MTIENIVLYAKVTNILGHSRQNIIVILECLYQQSFSIRLEQKINLTRKCTFGPINWADSHLDSYFLVAPT